MNAGDYTLGFDKRSTDHALCTLSGGFDSAATLLMALDQRPTEALFVTYGQRYEIQERRAAVYLASACAPISQHPNFRGLRSVSADLCLMPPGNPCVPYRNLVIAALATNIAVATGVDAVYFGGSQKAFYEMLEDLVWWFQEPGMLLTVSPPKYRLPLMGWSKKQTLTFLYEHSVDLHKLWNCYRGDEVLEPCGECEHCMTTQPLIEQVIIEAISTADAIGRW